MIVLVGAVFATTTTNAYIDINATVEEVAPNFALATTSLTANVTDAAAADSVHAQADASALVQYLLSESSTDLQRTISFSINQTSLARLATNTLYTLTVSANDLVLADNTGTEQAPVWTPKAAPGANEKFTCKTTAPSISRHADITQTINGQSVTLAAFAAGATNNIMTITYGGLVEATDGIGTFDVVWNYNQYAVNGHYLATVQLEVVAP